MHSRGGGHLAFGVRCTIHLLAAPDSGTPGRPIEGENRNERLSAAHRAPGLMCCASEELRFAALDLLDSAADRCGRAPRRAATEAHQLMLRLRILREAAEELDDAAACIERQRSGYAALFLEASSSSCSSRSQCVRTDTIRVRAHPIPSCQLGSLRTRPHRRSV